ncbi:patatin-like phospholipase family protein [Phenylobacterium sp.]|uniref:patatin-like phospholipase family protein n=1 Tax=Phenylobacterium sp. TaxID=1871053 RepID=UPI002DE844BF|nr:patatin-like phospholipase family protein [Phenylobacterium sp.]
MSRALVLGGGGPVGIAWECGLIAGLAKQGVDLGQADFILGTSAGSFVGARLAMGDEPAGLAEPILAEAGRAPPPAPGPQGERRPPDLSKLMEMMGEAQAGLGNPAEARARIGAFALEAQTIGEEAFIASFGRTLAGLDEAYWPPREFACTAVDAETGGFQLWTRGSGVGLARAVASSCSVPGIYPPVTLKGRRYIDGGMRSSTNADLATGHARVVVVAIRVAGGLGGAAAERIRARLDEEIATLRDGGAEVALVTPDEASQQAFGPNLMDFRRRPDAAAAGLAQGAALAAELAARWP